MINKYIAGLAILTAFNANAARDYSLSNFSYDTINVHVGLTDKQITADATKTVHPNAHLSLEISTDVDDQYQMSSGINFHAPITDWADLHGGIKGVYKDDGQKDDTGWAFEVGYRQWVSPQIEAFAKVQWDYIDESDAGIRIGGLFHATSSFSLGATVGFNEVSDENLLLSTRFEF
ncbi:hypothetical protein [Vibrio owensii]|uniref:hypothetical protein n=1 Tax=Vibrio owensii TaxID=696485 RepID=UPI0018F160A6|nr:hypothetical protein [Vibrio owensii]